MKTLLFLLVLPCLVRATPESAFHQATVYYNEGAFEKALASYQSIDAISAELDYNLGNTLMRLGRTSEAIAHYRRAQWLAPGDPDIRANLAQAVSTYNAPVPDLPLSRSLTGWWSPGTWQRVFLGSCWITAALGLLTTIVPRGRPLAFWVLPPAAVLLCLSGFATWASLPAHFTSEAVIRGPQGITRFEPLPDATEQTALPGGTVVEVLESTRDWYRIASGEPAGWIREADVVKL